VARAGNREAAIAVVDDVIVCSVVAFGDSDAVVRCFARDAGRTSAFARGARASKRRFPGLTAPALGRATWRPRRGSDMLDLAELDVDTRLLGLGSDLRGWAFAGYVVELVERVLPEGAPQPEFFDVVVRTLVSLARPQGTKAKALRAFELELLATLGVLPDLSDVVDDPGEACVAYDPVAGHLLAHGAPGALAFSEDARRAAIALLDVGGANDGEGDDVDEALLREVAVLFSSWLRRQAIELRSLDVLRAVRGTVDL
jgi:recombinational DNA repair protein (RecF pathway)